jgi:hypothetical protein
MRSEVTATDVMVSTLRSLQLFGMVVGVGVGVGLGVAAAVAEPAEQGAPSYGAAQPILSPLLNLGGVSVVRALSAFNANKTASPRDGSLKVTANLISRRKQLSALSTPEC